MVFRAYTDFCTYLYRYPQVYGSNMTHENEKKYYLPSLDLSYSLGELFFFVEATGLRALLIG